MTDVFVFRHGIEGEVNTADHYRRSARYQHINEELIVVQKATPGGGIEAH